MASEPSTEVTITVPYSGEIKKGLLIIINCNHAFGTCLITDYSNGRVFATVKSRYLMSAYDLGVSNAVYSNGVFTLTLQTGTSGDYKVSFLQLNLD